MPQAILIIGPTSSGKTSLAQALQEALLPDVWLHFSVDSIIYGLPPSVLERCNTKDDWSGVDGTRLYQGALASLQGLLESGNRVVFDAALAKQERAEQLAAKLKGFDVFKIQLVCSWDELERRTRARGDRTIDEARRSLERSNIHLDFDAVVDTSSRTSIDLARQLAKPIVNHFT